MSPKEALGACVAGQLDLPNTADLVEKFRELNQNLAALGQLQLGDLIDALLPPGSEACSVLREAALLEQDEFETAADVLECIRTNVTQPAMPEDVDYVRVMSLHKSKGLTSKVAIISGCIQGLIPFMNSDETPQQAASTLEEQRRLFYVAVTRCTERLIISSAVRMSRKLAWKIGARVAGRQGAVAPSIASQFIHEFGPDLPQSVRGADWSQNGYGA